MRKINNLCVRSYPPTAFASFTGSAGSAGNDDAALSRSLAENVDLPTIFRTIDQGVVPGLILTTPIGEVLICSGYSLIITEDTIAITFAPIIMLGISVSISLSKIDPGGAAVRIPGSEWYLEASMQSST